METDVVVRRAPGHVVLRGELDIATVPQLHEALRRSPADHGALVVDLRRVTFLDRRALDAILQAGSTDAAPIVFEAPSAPVRRLLRLTKADRLVEVRPGA